MNPVFATLPTSIFETMSLAARETGAINLGQGFPESDGYDDVREAAGRALMEQSNQYPPMRGLPALRQAVSAYYARTQGLIFDPVDEVLITSGATEAIAAGLLALITPGDEVVVFEPMYDAYVPLIERAGGVVRLIRLDAPDWQLEEAALTEAFSARTRLVMLTTPNNPTTHCFSRADLELIGQYCARFDAYVLSDEVWEAVVFDRTHISVAHIDTLKNRSLKIGSAGKIFALTGWKVGFVTGPKALIDQLARAHQFITFTTPPALQSACAFGLSLPQSRFDDALAGLKASRDLMVKALSDAGIKTLTAHGTYFVNIDLKASGIDEPGIDLSFRLVKDHGVASIPLAAFCPSGRDLAVLRLCFAKSDATLREGLSRLIHGLKA
jgi:N-succinyldiaminopimelate aminotransferase